MKHRRTRRLSKREMNSRRKRAAQEARSAAFGSFLAGQEYGAPKRKRGKRANLKRGREFMSIRTPDRPMRYKKMRAARAQELMSVRTPRRARPQMGKRKKGGF